MYESESSADHEQKTKQGTEIAKSKRQQVGVRGRFAHVAVEESTNGDRVGDETDENDEETQPAAYVVLVGEQEVEIACGVVEHVLKGTSIQGEYELFAHHHRRR